MNGKIGYIWAKSTSHLTWAKKSSNSYQKCQNYIQSVDISAFYKASRLPNIYTAYVNSLGYCLLDHEIPRKLLE